MTGNAACWHHNPDGVDRSRSGPPGKGRHRPEVLHSRLLEVE
jgi:hypothetical protein